MNNFEKIKSMNIDEMAEMEAVLISSIFFKIDAILGLNLDYKKITQMNKNDIKQWLESEVQNV